jgi:hypothetical protein
MSLRGNYTKKATPLSKKVNRGAHPSLWGPAYGTPFRSRVKFEDRRYKGQTFEIDGHEESIISKGGISGNEFLSWHIRVVFCWLKFGFKFGSLRIWENMPFLPESKILATNMYLNYANLVRKKIEKFWSSQGLSTMILVLLNDVSSMLNYRSIISECLFKISSEYMTGSSKVKTYPPKPNVGPSSQDDLAAQFHYQFRCSKGLVGLFSRQTISQPSVSADEKDTLRLKEMVGLPYTLPVILSLIAVWRDSTWGDRWFCLYDK